MKSKTFMSILKSERASKYGGCETVLRVYRIKRNKPEFITDVRYNTASYRGRDHETIGALVELGHLPMSVMEKQHAPTVRDKDGNLVDGKPDRVYTGMLGYCGWSRREKLGIKLYEL